jgi:hypothetical protein
MAKMMGSWLLLVAEVDAPPFASRVVVVSVTVGGPAVDTLDLLVVEPTEVVEVAEVIAVASAVVVPTAVADSVMTVVD